MTDARPSWATRIRAERKARGWPAEEMARRLRDAADPRTRAQLPALELLVRYVRRWESGAHQVTERYRLLYARVFGVDDEDLFANPRQPDPGVLPAVVVNSGVTADDEQRLARAAAAPSRLDARVPESLAAILAEQRRLEDQIGSAPLVGPVRAQVDSLGALVVGARGQLRPRVLDVASQWAQFAGWLHVSTGDGDCALHYLSHALEWATEIGDAAMVGSVMSWKGYIAEQAGHVGRMIGLSQAAQRSRTPVGEAYDLYQEARGHALVGDSDQVDRLVDRATCLASKATPDDARPWEYYYFSPGFFSMEHGLTYRILGRIDPSRNDEAIRLLTAGLRDLPDDVRSSDWAGDFIYQLAVAYTQAHEPEAAAAEAAEAAALARRTASDTLLTQVRRLHVQLVERWPNHPTVAELGDALRSP